MTKSPLFIVTNIIVAAGLTPILIRFAQAEGIPSLVIVLIRLWLISALLLPLVWIRYRQNLFQLTRSDLLLTTIAGFWLAMNLFMLFLALEYTSVLVTSVLRRTTPVWIIVPEIIFLGTVFTRRFWFSLALTLVGVVLISFGAVDAIEAGSRPFLGAALAAFGALCLGIYLLIGRRLIGRMPSLLYSWLVFLSAGIVATLLVIITHTPITGYSRAAYMWTFIVTILAQVVGHIFINLGLQHFTATAMSVILQIGVVVSAVIALFVFGEVPSPMQIVGSILIVTGVFMATRTQAHEAIRTAVTP